MSDKAINAFMDQVSEKYGRGEDGDSSTCSTGDKFNTLCINNTGSVIKPEGHAMLLFDSSGEAWIRFIQAFDYYMRGKSGPIYWRQEPKLLSDGGRYAFSARLFAAS